MVEGGLTCRSCLEIAVLGCQQKLGYSYFQSPWFWKMSGAVRRMQKLNWNMEPCDSVVAFMV
jgi:hypothetical protein